ncbi:RidA family protein [Pseudogracilibacillus sp. SE30717A]|uniref:RidA family protein n=1 Tax=Pseudogracilibacillus sp. SE30717A TaxID=3098293 RepID=UPI00300DCBEC
MSTPEEKLTELGLELPELRPAVGTYVSRVRTGNLIFTAGQGVDEYHGKLGRDLTTEEGYLAAQQSMLNLLAVIKDEMGELSKITKFVKLLVMVNSTEDFTEQPIVANGASDLLGKLFGDKGKHGRSAVGMAQLPNNTAIEIEMVVEVAD